MEVSIDAAKHNLSKLVKRAEQGEEIILSRYGRPVVKLVKLKPKLRELGLFRGQIKEIDPDWWKPMTDLSRIIKAAIRGEKVILTSRGKPLVRLVPEASKPKHPGRGYGALKDVLNLPPSWDSPEAEEEFAAQFEVVREAKGLPPR